ncbi:MAG: protein kinase [Gemmatimonadales bacterium]
MEREIGRGGMGIVYLARDVALDREVAIKVLPTEWSYDSGMRARFVREARTAAKLSHPNIVPIHSVEEAGDFVFFVMSYVRGQSLAQRIAERGPLRTDDAVRLLREVAWALAYAHAQGVVHRDVKPDNILLEDGSGRALVADFGIAQIVGLERTSYDGMMLGTPEFMSPEQAAGEPADARSDIYSLGCVAYYVLAGQAVFRGDTPADVLAMHIGEPPPRISAAAPGVSRKLGAVIDKCLSKDPADRIQSGEQLAEVFGTAVEGSREVPVALRVFLERMKQAESRRAIHVVFTVYLVIPIGGMIGLLLAGPLPAKVGGLLSIAALAALPVWIGARRARKLIAAGHTREDLVAALERGRDDYREQLSYLYGDDYAEKSDKYKRTAWLAGVTSILLMAVGGAVGDPTMAGLLISASGLGAIGTVVAGGASQRRSDKKWKRRIKFWQRRIGQWLFKLGGYGLADVEAQPALTAGRPTELALGMAVAGLFKALPAEIRATLGDVPEVVHALEDDARRVRARVDELDQLVADADETKPRLPGDEALQEQRQKAVARLTAARDEARARLAETVTALENLRIDLLRMKAGTVNIESFTTNLGNARDVSQQVERLLEAQRELDEEFDA